MRTEITLNSDCKKSISVKENKEIFLFDEYNLTNSIIHCIGDKFKNIKLTIDEKSHQPLHKKNSQIKLYIYKNENIVKIFDIDCEKIDNSVLFDKNIEDLNLFSYNMDKSCVYFSIETFGDIKYSNINIDLTMIIFDFYERREISRTLEYINTFSI